MYDDDEKSFKQYFRMNRDTFNALLKEISPTIKKNEHQLEECNIASGKVFDYSQIGLNM